MLGTTDELWCWVQVRKRCFEGTSLLNVRMPKRVGRKKAGLRDRLRHVNGSVSNLPQNSGVLAFSD